MGERVTTTSLRFDGADRERFRARLAECQRALERMLVELEGLPPAARALAEQGQRLLLSSLEVGPGDAALSAVYPDARNPFAHPTLLQDEGLAEWAVPEVWIIASPTPNHWVDITDNFEAKVAALKQARAVEAEGRTEMDRRLVTFAATLPAADRARFAVPQLTRWGLIDPRAAGDSRYAGVERAGRGAGNHSAATATRRGTRSSLTRGSARRAEDRRSARCSCSTLSSAA